VGAGHSTHVSVYPVVANYDIGGYSNVKVYVCNNYNGYRCGVSV
jgi:hypothetical protein